MDLTSREKEVLSWIKKGKPSSQISSIMDISENTVNFHIQNIFNKLGAENRAQAVAIAYEKELQELDLALRELNHRIMNNFQILGSLINIKGQGLKDKEASKVLKDISVHLKGFVAFHNILLKEEKHTSVSARSFILDALENFTGLLDNADMRIVIEHDIEDLRLDINRAVTCLQIISELISNSLKHAFPDNQCGRIRVKLSSADDSKGTNGRWACIEVEDTGVGIPMPVIGNQNISSGMKIVTALARQLGGSIEACSKNKSCLSVKFPQNRV